MGEGREGRMNNRKNYWIITILLGLLLVPLISTAALASENEEQWNYTMIDVADLQGQDNYRVSSASIVEVTRRRLETGELKYNYAIKRRL